MHNELSPVAHSVGTMRVSKKVIVTTKLHKKLYLNIGNDMADILFISRHCSVTYQPVNKCIRKLGDS